MASRIVAFLDVLGFKTLVEHVSQPELVQIYRELLTAVRSQTTIPSFPEDQRKFEEDPFYEMHELIRERVVNVVTASDSIVLYSPGDGYRDALAIMAAVRSLLVAGFRDGIPLRGALTVGELDELTLADDAVNATRWTARFGGLVGIALVRATQLEQRCAWSGAILHPDLVVHLSTMILEEFEDGPLTALDLLRTHCALETGVPVKAFGPNGAATIEHEEHWAIDWPLLARTDQPPISEADVAASFASHGRALSNEAEIKRDETIAFMRRAGSRITSS